MTLQTVQPIRLGCRETDSDSCGSFRTGGAEFRECQENHARSLASGKKSEDATEKDKQVGTAAKMIGVKKNIIVVAAGPFQFAMINPVITRKSGAFETEEGCLSLDGVRSCTRYEEIEVDHCNGIVI